MTKQANGGKKSQRTTRRPTKAEQARQRARKKLLVTSLVSLVLVIGLVRLGRFGVTIYNMLRFAFGSLAYVATLAILAQLIFQKWLKKQDGLVIGFWTVFAGLLLTWHAYLFWSPPFKGSEVFSSSLTVLVQDLTSFKVQAFMGGGMLGALLYKPVSFLFSNIGSFLIGGLLILFGLFLMTPWDIYDVIDFLRNGWATHQERAEISRQKRFVRREERRLEREKRLEELALRAQEEAEAQVQAKQAELADLTTEPVAEPAEDASQQDVEILLPATADWPEEEEVYDLDFDLAVDLDDDWGAGSDLVAADQDGPSPVEPMLSGPSLLKQQLLYKLPSIDLFAPDKPKNQSKEKKIVRENIKILEQTFASFGIKVTVERAEIGPSVTKYEVKPATGVRVNRISNLADDLALALAAKDVRIEAPIPGKSLVGIEVPNSEIATVSFRELWEQAKTNPDNLLEVPLGKAVNGTSRAFDLARMPHILVAGSTGSGKSVAVNGIISSILMKARPDQVKFMMIDPKMVELSVYNDIPHLLIPVVTNPRKASKALQKVVDEMENRYELFSKIGVRNIAGYNAKVDSWNQTSEEKQIPLPLLVVIVDELADLMMVASKEVEDAIIRLGQKARAAGIHMILATQRPSVDVISGLIKANVPSRIAFAVSSGTDSRTILDTNGAEKLLGRGDMLFKPIDENHPVRLQGSFISDDDVERIVSFIKAQADADYDESFDPGEVADDDPSGNGGAAQGDPLFEQAKALIIESQKASASMLQRRLSIGFNRATDLMSELEEAGVIGPAEGTKPRKVLMTK